MKLIKEQEILGKQFKVFGDFENPLFLAKDVKDWIEHSHMTNMLSTLDDEEKLTATIFYSGQNRSMWFITEVGLIKVITKARNILYDDKIKLLSQLVPKHKEKILLNTIKEIEFLSKLEEVIKPFNLKGIKQYRVNNYIVDFYIESLNIVIEYDENDHKNYSYDCQEKRQEDIEKELKCKFIRVSDYKSDLWNIGYIIKCIFDLRANIDENKVIPVVANPIEIPNKTLGDYDTIIYKNEIANLNNKLITLTDNYIKLYNLYTNVLEETDYVAKEEVNQIEIENNVDSLVNEMYYLNNEDDKKGLQ